MRLRLMPITVIAVEPVVGKLIPKVIVISSFNAKSPLISIKSKLMLQFKRVFPKHPQPDGHSEVSPVEKL